MKRSISMSEPMNEKLKEIAEAQSITVTAAIMIACSDYIRKWEKERAGDKPSN
ncbi:MAG: hypothetical protein FWC60_05370 [Firmicutes bacterium]|nr:hypothetical protein [Bacillota bacterium]